MKLSLNKKSVDALRDLAKSMPIAIENISQCTEKLYQEYQAVFNSVGPHEQDFKDMLDIIKKAQETATEAIEELPTMLNATADKMEFYVSPSSITNNFTRPKHCDIINNVSMVNAIKNIDINNLPQNVQDAYKGYGQNGWQGKYSGQSPKTKSGKTYHNKNGWLPLTDDCGNSITYREFDVNAPIVGTGRRDAQRFVVGSDGSIYFTDSHYGQGVSPSGLPPFVKIKEN